MSEYLQSAWHRSVMNRSAERELTFKLLFMSDFYDRKEITDELPLYFDAPLPFNDTTEENDDKASENTEYVPLGESINDSVKTRIIEKFSKIIEKSDEIDAKISEVSKGWTIDRIGKAELAILRLAVYEILFDDDIPASVAINEAVELAKRFGQESSYSFVNGILANFA